ncbi:MAG: M12 family metallopeptidase [Ferruginibacter sp.]
MKKTSILTAAVFCISISSTAQTRQIGCSAIESGMNEKIPNMHQNVSDTTKGRSLADNYFLWNEGSIVKVKFLSGSRALRTKMFNYAKEWEKYANIKFQLVEFGDAEIRIFIGRGNGHSSYIGTVARNIDPEEETMNLDSADIGNDFVFMKGVVLHEFGHAIGLLHEHSSPISGIKWNKEKLYKAYKEQQGWDKEMVDFQVFRTYNTSYTNGSKYDPKSIMHYPIYPEETLDGYSVGWNNLLSKGDINIVTALYPKKGKRLNEVTRVEVQNFKEILLESNIKKGGISLFPTFDLKSVGKTGRVKMVFTFLDAIFQFPLLDEDGTYQENGVVATIREVLIPANKVIKYNQKKKKDFEFFLPLDQIPPYALEENILVEFKVVVETKEGEMKNMYQSQPLMFKYSKK